MIDHVLGRPSNAIKRLEVILTTLAVSYYLKGSDRHPPSKLLKWLNRIGRDTPAWKIVIWTILGGYLSQNLMLLLWLNGPERFSKMYTRNFFRATYINTALDAGFYTCMNIRNKYIRDLMSIFVSVMYLFFPDAANAKVLNTNKVQQYPTTVEVMRTAWEKNSNPYLYALSYFDRGYLETRKNITIPRPSIPSQSSFDMKLGPIEARVYFPGNAAQLAKAAQLVFNVHGKI
jgi:hypothetical protein